MPREYPPGYAPTYGLVAARIAIGETHGRLTLVAYVRKYRGGLRGRFSCVCGGELVAQLRVVKSGVLTSCGCAPRKA